MRATVLRFLLISMAISVTGCQKAVNSHQSLEWEGHKLEIEFKEARNNGENVGSELLIFAKVKIKTDGEVHKHVNFNCLDLTILGEKNKAVYIDSVAHMLAGQYALPNRETIVDIYWEFSDSFNKKTLGADKPHLTVKKGCILIYQ